MPKIINPHLTKQGVGNQMMFISILDNIGYLITSEITIECEEKLIPSSKIPLSINRKLI